jgi:hypothetical protein
MIMVEKVYSVMEIELTMNEFPVITSHGADTKAVPLDFNISV